MIWAWRTFFSAAFFSAAFLMALAALPLVAATVSGRVELKDSRDPAVRKKLDYSGVVISLKPLNGVLPARITNVRARMLQKNKTFTPQVLAVTVGASVDFPNLDPIFHNAFSSYNGQIFDVGLYAPGTSQAVHFRREGVVRVFCNIHSSMSAVIVVLATPYFDTTNVSGAFEIPNVAPGEYEMHVFHERATDATLARLERRVSVNESNIALPVISISESGYLPIPHKNKYGRDYRPETDDHNIYPAVRK
jgi:plastocyanin